MKKLPVNGIRLDQTYLMLVEPARKSKKSSVELIKSILEKRLEKPERRERANSR